MTREKERERETERERNIVCGGLNYDNIFVVVPTQQMLLESKATTNRFARL